LKSFLAAEYCQWRLMESLLVSIITFYFKEIIV